MTAFRFVFIALCFRIADFSDPPGCTIELQCSECVPENMPSVRGGEPPEEGGAVRVSPGGEVALACGGGRFLAYPAREEITAVCEGGLFRVPLDRSLRHLLDLGCQESVFEDVLHEMEHCAPPRVGRAYLMRETGGAVRHLAGACYDQDRGVATHLHARNYRAPLAPHEHRAAPLSLLGNFNEMFDARTRRLAERLYADEAALTRRVRELVKHDRLALAEQTLAAAPLLSPEYFAAEHLPVARFASGRAAVWASVARGNLRLVQRATAELLRRLRGRERLEVFAGTHGVAALGAAPRRELRLAGARLPVPRYVWTAVVSRERARGLALVVLNDPFVAVSEIRAAVFCESACGAVSWVPELLRQRDYERPVRGLVFCCGLREFAAVVPEMPAVFNDSFVPFY